MAEITAELVKKLRDTTNVSMMECKRALVEAGGDMEKASRILREKGMATAAKKAARTANQGLVVSASSADGRTLSLVEVNCETDFVARNADFIEFARSLATRALEVTGSLAEKAKDEVTARIAKIGENIVVKRNALFTLQGEGMVISYIHLGGKVGVLAEIGAGKGDTASKDAFKELARDITLHIAACNPKHLVPEDVPAAEIASEREIYAAQVKDKPAQIVDKIVDGKLKKYFADVCLLEQPFVREPKTSVKALLAQKSKELGDTVTIRRFTRYQLGE